MRLDQQCKNARALQQGFSWNTAGSVRNHQQESFNHMDHDSMMCCHKFLRKDWTLMDTIYDISLTRTNPIHTFASLLTHLNARVACFDAARQPPGEDRSAVLRAPWHSKTELSHPKWSENGGDRGHLWSDNMRHKILGFRMSHPTWGSWPDSKTRTWRSLQGEPHCK